MPSRPHRLRLLPTCLAALLVASCGGGAEGEGHHDQAGGHAPTYAFGEPGEAGKADHTVRVRMLDSLKFDPPAVEVEAGETVTFDVVNEGVIVHEFYLGDEAAQAEHAREMAQLGPGSHMEGHPNGLELAGGESGTLTWTFTRPGTVRFECHEPGHVAGGMVGTITVK